MITLRQTPSRFVFQGLFLVVGVGLFVLDPGLRMGAEGGMALLYWVMFVGSLPAAAVELVFLLRRPAAVVTREGITWWTGFFRSGTLAAADISSVSVRRGRVRTMLALHSGGSSVDIDAQLESSSVEDIRAMLGISTNAPDPDGPNRWKSDG